MTYITRRGDLKNQGFKPVTDADYTEPNLPLYDEREPLQGVERVTSPTVKETMHEEGENTNIHRIGYKVGSGGGGSPGDDIQSMGAVNQPGTHDDLYARDDHVHAGPAGFGPGNDIQSVALANDPGTHDLLYARDDHVHSSRMGGGDQEKPWDYHVIERMISQVDETTTGSNNGLPSERCVAVVNDQYYGTRVFTVWHDGGIATNPHGTCGRFFLTIQHLGSPTFPPSTATQYIDQSLKYHTYTYELSFSDYTGGDYVNVYPENFCIVADPGDPNDPAYPDAPYLHIVFRGYNTQTTGIDIYDAYTSVDSFGPPSNPNGVVTNMEIGAEVVNFGQRATDPSSPSACYQPRLVKGHGIVVVWTQNDDGDPSVDRIYSNCYDPTQAVGSRYNTGLTGYAIAMVSDPAAGAGQDAQLPTVEADITFTCCTYLMDTNGGGIGIFFSKSGGTGCLAPFWPSILSIATGALTALGGDAPKAPSMVILSDSTGIPNYLCMLAVVVMDDGELTGLYFSDDASTTGQACSQYYAFVPTLQDGLYYENDATPYQLGASLPQLGEDEDAILFLYKCVARYPVGEETDTPPRIFVMQYRACGLIVEQPPVTGWNQVVLDMNCTQINGVDGAGALNTNPIFSPKVAYSNQYPVRAWKAQYEPWYPISVASRLSVETILNVAGRGTDATYENVIILKDVPLYTIGDMQAP